MNHLINNLNVVFKRGYWKHSMGRIKRMRNTCVGIRPMVEMNGRNQSDYSENCEVQEKQVA